MTLGLFGIPNPIGWGYDRVQGWVGDVVGWSFQAVIGGLVGWVVDGVGWLVGQVFGFIVDSASPNVEAAWFIGGGDSGPGPWLVMATLAGSMLLLALLVGIIHGVVSGRPGAIVRRVVLDAPLVVFVIFTITAFTAIAVQLSDELSNRILANFGDDAGAFLAGLGRLALLQPGVSGAATSFAVFVFGLFTFFAAIAIWMLLLIRQALIYFVVALAPLAAVTLVTSYRGVFRRLMEILFALIFSKVLIVLALALGAAALGAGQDGTGTVAVGPPPTQPGVTAPDTAGTVPSQDLDDADQVAAEQIGVADVVGQLMVGFAIFVMGAFSPFLLMKVMPVIEGAVVAQGVAKAPVNNMTQAIYSTNAVRSLGSGARQRPQWGAMASQTGSGAAQAGAARAGAGGAAAAAAGAGGAATGIGAGVAAAQATASVAGRATTAGTSAVDAATKGPSP